MPKRKINSDAWYIVDTLHLNWENILTPVLLIKTFDKKIQASRQLPLLKDNMRYDIISGAKAIYYKLIFMPKLQRFDFRLVKYNYDEEATTFQERKSFRHKARRHSKQSKSN